MPIPEKARDYVKMAEIVFKIPDDAWALDLYTRVPSKCCVFRFGEARVYPLIYAGKKQVFARI